MYHKSSRMINPYSSKIKRYFLLKSRKNYQSKQDSNQSWENCGKV